VNGLGLLRGIVVAGVTYGIVFVICAVPAQGFDPFEQQALYAVVIAASLIGAAAGTAAGAWQARAGGVRGPGLGLAAPALTVIVIGVLLTSANGGTSDTGDLLIYLAHPVGALAGALAYGRRWLVAVR